jgi:AcrR family transcriptional regulator
VADAEIIKAAVAITLDSGPASLTFARLAQSSGLSAATVVHRFGGRDELIRSVSRMITLGIETRCQLALAGSMDVVAFLISLLPRDPRPSTVAHQFALLELERSDPRLCGDVSQRSLTVRATIEAMLRRDQASALENMISNEQLAALLEQQLVGIQLCWSMNPAGSLLAQAEEALRLLMRGFMRS